MNVNLGIALTKDIEMEIPKYSKGKRTIFSNLNNDFFIDKYECNEWFTPMQYNYNGEGISRFLSRDKSFLEAENTICNYIKENKKVTYANLIA